MLDSLYDDDGFLNGSMERPEFSRGGKPWKRGGRIRLRSGPRGGRQLPLRQADPEAEFSRAGYRRKNPPGQTAPRGQLVPHSPVGPASLLEIAAGITGIFSQFSGLNPSKLDPVFRGREFSAFRAILVLEYSLDKIFRLSNPPDTPTARDLLRFPGCGEFLVRLFGGGGGNRTLVHNRSQTLAGRGFSSIYKLLQNSIHPISSHPYVRAYGTIAALQILTCIRPNCDFGHNYQARVFENDNTFIRSI